MTNTKPDACKEMGQNLNPGTVDKGGGNLHGNIQTRLEVAQGWEKAKKKRSRC